MRRTFFTLENFTMWEGKTNGNVVHTKINYINVYECNHVLSVQYPEQNRDFSYKKLSPTQEQQQQESNTKASKQAARRRPQLIRIPETRD